MRENSPCFVLWSIIRGPTAVLLGIQCVSGFSKTVFSDPTTEPLPSQKNTHAHTCVHTCTQLFVRFKYESRKPGKKQA